LAVEAIRLQNFMAFEDTGWLDLRPITLLFGRNSSGKSAIIKALLLLRQSLNADPDEGPLLFLDPDGYDFGDFSSILHQAEGVSRHRSDQEEDELKGEITFGLRCSKIDERFARYLQKVLEIREQEFGEQFDSAGDHDNTYELCLTFRQYYKDLQSKEIAVVLSDVRIVCPWIEHDGEPQVIFEANNLLYSETSPEIGYKWHFNTDVLYEHRIKGQEEKWRELEIETDSGFLPVLKVGRLSLMKEDEIKGDVDFVSSLLIKLGDEVKVFLKSVNHIRPLRPEPRRVYALDEKERKRWQKQGWRLFLDYLNKKADAPQLTEIDSWLQRLGLAEMADIWSSPRKLRDSVYSDLSLKEPRKDQTGNKKKEGKEIHSGFNILDVGFGVSQVLPIIAQCVLAKPGALIIIEQPELHLHPRAQAQLGDLFVDAIYEVEVIRNEKDEEKIQREKRDIRFLLETHSEHLLLRFRRRLAESSAGKHQDSKDPSLFLNADDIGVCFVGRPDSNSFVEEIVMNEFGEFMNIPIGFEDFFSDDSVETAKMVRARLDAGSTRKGQKDDSGNRPGFI
jgi:hypothetical protein